MILASSGGSTPDFKAACNSNITGTWGGAGAIRHLELLLKHKSHCDICMIHVNELPLRCLIIKLDGPYISKSGWTGPIGKLLERVDEIKVNPDFIPFADVEDLIKLPEEVVCKLSTDQKNCYLLHAALKSGILPPELAKIKCGELSQSRWLTTSQALMMLWTRFHGVEGETLRILELLVRFSLTVYLQLYYQIKVKHNISCAPEHILKSVQLLNQQTDEVKNLITSVIQRGAYHAHSENILASLLTSTDKDDRKFAVDKILTLRNGNDKGCMEVRYHKTPQLNLSASTTRELIEWNNETYEPVFTCELNCEELKKIYDEPLPIPPFSLHTQSCERAVQEVSAASKEVHGENRRDGFVRARMLHREVVPIFGSKKDILPMCY